MARGGSRKVSRKRKIKIEVEEEEKEKEEEKIEEKAHANKLPKTETCQPWRIAESTISTTPEVLDHSAVEIDSIFTEDKKLNVWWYDAFEKKQEGVVYFFGKVFDKSKDCHVSCSIKIKDIKREIYVLPRPFRVDYNSNQTTKKVHMDDVKEEMTLLLKKKKILNYEFEVCTRKYAFGLADVPTSAEYLLVRYSYNQYGLPSTLSGQTFSHVFGTDTGPLEHVLLRCDIMGPCWLTFDDPSFPEEKETWSKVNATIDVLEKCSTMKDDTGASVTKGPPLTIMSLNLVTARNKLSDSNEIVIASAFVCPKVDIDDATSLESVKYNRFSIATKLSQEEFPDDIHDALADAYTQRDHPIQLEKTELGLVNHLLAKVHIIDPDVIVGHNFAGIHVEVLLKRMKYLKIPYWSKIGRMQEQKFPKLNQQLDSFTQELGFMSGRLLCDTFIALKDLINAKTYNLSELCKSQLNILREEIKLDEISQLYQSSTSLIDLISHCSFDAYLSLKLMFELQILPLTKQLTNLSGNKWSKSMHGARSDRNEHLLLHTFYKNGFVYPNKYTQYKKKKDVIVSKIESEVNSQTQDSQESITAQFSGGLVLEPKIGYYDHFVILLDFNSLYPSIIQEYNVCFTSRNDLLLSQENGKSNDNDDSEKGILPELVKILVEKRREIKSLMKDPNISESKKKQYDTQQMALKLTANSMYGCLGSSFSRFYAKDLAMFITFMGRTILKNTVDLAKEMGLDVIYGDTDSIMIDTKQDDFESAKRMAEELKHQVNQRYKLLEIGVDGYFKRTLLLKKKKYATLILEEKGNNEFTETIQSKGLDLVRRDWCDLSHDISGFVLKQILNSKSDSDISARLIDYLKTVKNEVSESLHDLSRFVIRKRLNKPLNQYSNNKGYQHITVARKMRQAGIDVRVGDTVPYVMCIGRYTPIPAMPEDVLFGKYKLDMNWYLSQQILPPISRLCAPLHDITNKKLISALGIDETIDVQEAAIKEDPDLDADTEIIPKKKDAILMTDIVEDGKKKFVLICSRCLESNTYDGPIRRNHNGSLVCGLLCNYCNTMSPASIETQVILEIRKNIDEYYKSPFICNNEWCGTIPDGITVVSNRGCPNVSCHGKLVRKFSDNTLYSRLSYLHSLFDITSVQRENYKDSESEIANDIIEKYSSTFNAIKNCIEGYEKRSGFRFIDLPDLLNISNSPSETENDKPSEMKTDMFEAMDVTIEHVD